MNKIFPISSGIESFEAFSSLLMQWKKLFVWAVPFVGGENVFDVKVFKTGKPYPNLGIGLAPSGFKLWVENICIHITTRLMGTTLLLHIGAA